MTFDIFERHNTLSWRIIEYKLFYYRPEKVHKSWHSHLTITDAEYDALEIEYITLCRELGKKNTVVHKEYPGFSDIDFTSAMVEVDFIRPSVQLVLSKLSRKRVTHRRQ